MLPGWIGRLEMPSWLRGTWLEAGARRVAQRVKRAGLRLERALRRGRVRVVLPSLGEAIWMDFDFAQVNSMPAEDPLLLAFLQHLRPGQSVFDVGGFVGSYSVAGALRTGDGRVIAFEPAPISARLLRKHCQLNGVSDRVRVIEAACSHQPGVLAMPVWNTLTTAWGSGNALFNLYPQQGVEPTWIPVCTVRLDDFVRAGAPPPDVIKIDVEGAELWVLEGAREILKAHRPFVFLEVHAFAWHLFETTEERLRTFLAEVGYELLEVARPHSPLRAIPDYGHALLRPFDPPVDQVEAIHSR